MKKPLTKFGFDIDIEADISGFVPLTYHLKEDIGGNSSFSKVNCDDFSYLL